MRFTWLTYQLAIRRSFKRECKAFNDHSRAVRGPDPWRKQMKHTWALEARQERERGNR